MADTKTTAETLAGQIARRDIVRMVGDPGGTPAMYRAEWDMVAGLAGYTPGGRLTTETGVPVSTGDRTAQATVYYKRFAHDKVRLYDGTRVRDYGFDQPSWSVSISSGQNKDLFLYDNAGTLTLEASAAWTNDTTRADALAWQTELGWVKSGTPTRLWLGTVRGDGTNTVADGFAKRFVWNAHNRTPRKLLRQDTTTSWTYNATSWRQVRATSANMVEIVVGLAGAAVGLDAWLYGDSVGSTYHYTGIGLDWSSGQGNEDLQTPGAYLGTGTAGPPVSVAQAGLRHHAAVGYHSYTWLEACGSATTTNFFSGTGAAAGNGISGLVGWVEA